MLPLRPLLATVAAMAALLAAASAADASTVLDYQVDARLVSDYHLSAEPPDGTADIKARFVTDVALPDVTFQDGVLQAPATGSSRIVDASTQAHFTAKDASQDCQGNTGGWIGQGPQIRRGAGASLVVSPFGGVAWHYVCTGSPTPSGLALVNLKDAVTAMGPFDAPVSFAPGPETVVVPVDRTVSDQTCPLNNVDAISCTLRTRGTVVFTLLDPSDVGTPGPGPSGPPSPPPPPTPVGDGPGTVELTVTDLSRDGKKLKIRAHCRKWCTRGIVRFDLFGYNTGSVGLSLGAKAAPAGRRIATKKVAIAADGS